MTVAGFLWLSLKEDSIVARIIADSYAYLLQPGIAGQDRFQVQFRLASSCSPMGPAGRLFVANQERMRGASLTDV